MAIATTIVIAITITIPIATTIVIAITITITERSDNNDYNHDRAK